MLRRSPKKQIAAPQDVTVSGWEAEGASKSFNNKAPNRSNSTLGRVLARARGSKLIAPTVVIGKDDVALVDSDNFTKAVSAIVFANVVCIGLETEMEGHNLQFSFVNNSFLLFYFVEICFRLLTHGTKAFSDFMTVLDVVVVVAAFIERMASSRGIARSLPTLRLGRLFRVLRSTNALKFSRELWNMVASVRTTMTSLFWMSMVLFLLLWTLAGFATDAVGSSAEWAVSMDPSLDNTLSPFKPFDVNEYFGSISRSFLTLFQVVTLSQWSNVARALINVYPILAVFFLAFLCTTTYGLLVAVIANLVVDSMIHSRENEKAVADHLRKTRTKVGQFAAHLLAAADRNGDGELDLDELTYALEELGLQQILVDLGVPVTNAKNLILMFDRNGDKSISCSELVEGAVSMDEPICHRDYVKLALWLENLTNRIIDLEKRLDRLAGSVRLQRVKLQAAFEALNRRMHAADETILRQRALKTIREQKPPEPKKIAGPQMYVHRTEASIREETNEFLSFARRFLGDSIPQIPEQTLQFAVDGDIPGVMPPSLGDGLRETARVHAPAPMPPAPPPRHVLPPAPPQQHVCREQNKSDREKEQSGHKYTAHLGQPSASTLHLRDIISRHRS